MRTTRAFFAVLLALTLAGPLAADARRRAVSSNPAEPISEGVDARGVKGAAISGTVASVSGSIVTLNSGGGAAIRIDTTNASFIGGREGRLTSADIRTGTRITAFIDGDAARPANGALPARLVAIEAAPDLSITGTIDSIEITASRFTVLGIPITVNSATSFGSSFPTFAPLRGVSDLAVGQTVNVDIAFSGSAPTASRVFVIMPGNIDGTTLRGKVKAISATSWVISDRDGKDVTVVVDERTKIAGNPKVGDEVQVVAVLNSASAYVALVILKLEMIMPRDVEVRGHVQAIAADQWTIGGPPGSMMPSFNIAITPSTTIYSNPKLGDSIVAIVSADVNGKFVAKSIKKVETPSGDMQVRGIVSVMAADRWVLIAPMSGAILVEVKITPATVIYANPRLGDQVIVSGTREASGIFTAQKITKAE